ncbi:hypothetical protein MKY48_29455 [Paenibacillus sp. FSL W8-0187]|uniref:hypothetical protein n=1 Tax=unclassified Paenibacillus TaxID=185978 RepID=UPI0030D813A6
MRSACYRIVWGLLLVLVDFKLETVDLLPELLGYLLIASGLWRLQALNGYFKAGHLSAWLLLIWSVLSLFWFPEVKTGGVPMQSVEELLIQLPAICLHMVLIFGICRGIQANSAGAESGLDHKARFRGHLFMAAQLLWLIAYPFILNLDSGDMIPVIFMCSLVVMVAEIAVMLLVRLAGREWAEGTE